MLIKTRLSISRIGTQNLNGNMAKYYKDGYLEAVLFLFIKDKQVLIEHRPKNGSKETFIPNGSIEDVDLSRGEDYRLAALKREISEEFANSVEIKKHISLGEFIAQPVKIKFYGYLITEWEGQIPEYTVEENKKFADLQWVPLAEYKRYSEFDTAVFFFEKTIEMMNNNE